MGLMKKVAKAGAKAAVKKINGGCPGNPEGKHNYTVHKSGDFQVFYCKNKGCGRARQ